MKHEEKIKSNVNTVVMSTTYILGNLIGIFMFPIIMIIDSFKAKKAK